MHLGVTIRNMGAQSAPDIMLGCAHAAQDRALESVWVTDHIAIPPDDAQGSEGRYTDTLTTLAWLGARRIASTWVRVFWLCLIGQCCRR